MSWRVEAASPSLQAAPPAASPSPALGWISGRRYGWRGVSAVGRRQRAVHGNKQQEKVTTSTPADLLPAALLPVLQYERVARLEAATLNDDSDMASDEVRGQPAASRWRAAAVRIHLPHTGCSLPHPLSGWRPLSPSAGPLMHSHPAACATSLFTAGRGCGGQGAAPGPPPGPAAGRGGSSRGGRRGGSSAAAAAGRWRRAARSSGGSSSGSAGWARERGGHGWPHLNQPACFRRQAARRARRRGGRGAAGAAGGWRAAGRRSAAPGLAVWRRQGRRWWQQEGRRRCGGRRGVHWPCLWCRGGACTKRRAAAGGGPAGRRRGGPPAQVCEEQGLPGRAPRLCVQEGAPGCAFGLGLRLRLPLPGVRWA